jgi:hypothetical protein
VTCTEHGNYERGDKINWEVNNKAIQVEKKGCVPKWNERTRVRVSQSEIWFEADCKSAKAEFHD